MFRSNHNDTNGLVSPQQSGTMTASPSIAASRVNSVSLWRKSSCRREWYNSDSPAISHAYGLHLATRYLRKPRGMTRPPRGPGTLRQQCYRVTDLPARQDGQSASCESIRRAGGLPRPVSASGGTIRAAVPRGRRSTGARAEVSSAGRGDQAIPSLPAPTEISCCGQDHVPYVAGDVVPASGAEGIGQRLRPGRERRDVA
jgi:hypothetical protein